MKSSDQRPVVYDYRSPVDFFAALNSHYRSAQKSFSIRRAVSKIEGCSPSLVTQVMKGRRRLTRDQLPAFAQIFKLTLTEVSFIDEQLKTQRTMCGLSIESSAPQEKESRSPKNHILTDWVNAYVKDTVHLKNFSLDTQVLHRILGGTIPPARIARAVAFLFREGFWKKTPSGKTVPDENVVETTVDIPNKKLRRFHKQALRIAMEGLEKYPTERRRATTVVVSVNERSLAELQRLIKKFHHELQSFVEAHPTGDEQMVQVTLHLTPVGGLDRGQK
jgi:uncharacterized protein (TIGR02147 family)